MKVSSAAIAAEVLRGGGLVVAPTDTVYGILADSTNDEAIRKVYAVKKRVDSKPLLLLISSICMARNVAYFSEQAEAIADHFWNSRKLPLTIVLAKANVTAYNISPLATAGGNTIAVRLPNHKLIVDIIEALGVPVVAPSANISGQRPSTTYEEAKMEWDGLIDLVLDGGCTPTATASTILDLSSGKKKILREGAVAASDIEDFR
ncbi:MAG: threonylcarbamoyl-AMP synthase [Holosporales bacterium]|nr:threonylcarbamoyl-AMP synthase [Holosporales bacterium]